MAEDTYSQYDVLLQGSPFCDLTFSFKDLDALPALGQEVYAQNFALTPGGIFNVASAFIHMGINVGLMAELGTDIFSQFIAEQMRSCALSLELTSWVEQPQPVVTVSVSLPHDRLFLSYASPHADRPERRRLCVEDLDRYRPKVLFTHGEMSIDLCVEARRRGILVFGDSAWNPELLHSSYLRDFIQHVDIFSPNLVEALEITGADTAEGALDLLSQWCRCVVIKWGAQGCLARCEGERYHVPAIPVEPIETTGAGDNFNAGLVYGMLQRYPFETCLQCANIAGGLSTQVIGGCGSNVHAVDIEGWLRRLQPAG